MAINMTVAYAVLGVYLLMVLGSGVVGAWFTWRSTLASLRGAQPVSEYTLVSADLRCDVFRVSRVSSCPRVWASMGHLPSRCIVRRLESTLWLGLVSDDLMGRANSISCLCHAWLQPCN